MCKKHSRMSCRIYSPPLLHISIFNAQIILLKITVQTVLYGAKYHELNSNNNFGALLM